MKGKHKILAVVFSILMSITLILNSVMIASHAYESTELEVIHVMVLDFVTLILFVASYFNYDFARWIQPIILVIGGYHSFIFDGFDIFWGWGLTLVGLLLAYEYGILKKNPKHKVCFIAVSYVATVIVCGFYSKDRIDVFLSAFVYMAFILFFAVVIYKNRIERFLELRNDYRVIADQLVVKQNELQELEERLENAENAASQDKINSAMAESLAKMNEDRDLLRNRIKAIPYIDGLSDTDIDMILSFYIAKGNKTNKELAFEIDRDENYVKNHLRTIYNKIPEVKSRTSLFSYISEHMER